MFIEKLFKFGSGETDLTKCLRKRVIKLWTSEKYTCLTSFAYPQWRGRFREFWSNEYFRSWIVVYFEKGCNGGIGDNLMHEKNDISFSSTLKTIEF